MPQAANIVLADAQATPVNHTFVPIGPDKQGVFWFEDQSATNAIGNWRISYEIKRPGAASDGQSSKDRSYRVRIGLHEPILENVTNSTVSGVAPAPTVAYTPRTFREYIMPERAVLQNRKDLRKMGALLDADATTIAVVETLQYIW